MPFNLCRFQSRNEAVRIGFVENEQVFDLSAAGVLQLTPLLENPGMISELINHRQGGLPSVALAGVRLLPPLEKQEVWAAGVTYSRSKSARVEESDFSATAYDRVYDAARPELFFKAMPDKVVGPAGVVGIRRDARWNVPEPELVLVVNSRGGLVGFTIGNDMSSRDIEGENLLYLPQAKIYDRSCAIGPYLRVGATEAEARTWQIHLQIKRGTVPVFQDVTSVERMKRTFQELIEYLCRSQTFPHGALLFTGTGIVPDGNFTLQPGDVVRIEISGIGALENRVEFV